MPNPGYPAVNEVESNDVEHRRRLAKALNGAMQGKINAVTTLTLTANVASTTLTDARINVTSYIGLMPMTANAATALTTTYVTTGNLLQGSATFTHANNAQTDRTFNVLIIG